jgi:hypothetical protein
MSVGETKVIAIPPDEGYGDMNTSMLFVMPLLMLAPVYDVTNYTIFNSVYYEVPKAGMLVQDPLYGWDILVVDADSKSDMVILMNNGLPDSECYDIDYAWPADLMAIERGQPPAGGYRKWRYIEGKTYYIPGEVCDSIAPVKLDWFWLEGDQPRPFQELLGQFQACKQGGANYLLNVGPMGDGTIPPEAMAVLKRVGAWYGAVRESLEEVVRRAIDYTRAVLAFAPVPAAQPK